MQFKIEANDHSLRQLILMHLVHQIEKSHDFGDDLLKQGVSGELLDLLRSQASLAEIVRIGGLSWPSFSIELDDTGLLNCFHALRSRRRDDKLMEYLARNGASSDLLTQWFSLSRADAEELRRQLNSRVTAGRPKLPDLATRDAIHEAWSSLPTGRPEREAYAELHQSFPGETITSLYRVIHEHDAVSTSSRGRKRKSATTQPEMACASACAYAETSAI